MMENVSVSLWAESLIMPRCTNCYFRGLCAGGRLEVRFHLDVKGKLPGELLAIGRSKIYVGQHPALKMRINPLSSQLWPPAHIICVIRVFWIDL